ncbi:MAG TPA: glycogen debranching N-terminal domain-containing protein [Gaiella sp.]|uniref:amylo-alpha-1,6-glucosidase n=1 Tax=Gaiella sp. TaxID=2663207 RepID=UPI002D80EC4E|nr:glycogen debranching N-terminal domain-containing protein [Gaiella sp.]HET9288676.1 glycogen debranching N-terminal domain-containing protein [Gaiella sp.]
MSANRGVGEETAAVARRPTPRDPYPQPRPPPTGKDERPHPIDLGPDAIAVLEGRTFMFSDSRGDVAPGTVGGLVHEDTRFVSRWELQLDGRPLSLLKSGQVDYDSAAFFLTNPDTPRLRAHSVAVRRLRLLGGGALEQIAVLNTSSESVSCELRLLCGADFADLFEIKSGVRDRSGSIVAAGAGRQSLRFRYQVPGFLAETTIRIERSEVVEAATEQVVAAAQPRVDGTDAVWALELPPRCLLLTLVKVGVRVNNVTFEPVAEGFGGRQQPVEGPLSGWLERIPRFEAKSALLTSVFQQSVVDLAALRITGDLLGESYVLPAAGLPWFMTLFGRDTLITSLQTLWVGPGLARGALHLLGALQGMQIDDFRDEEPGKILHEVRSGELTRLGEMPHSPYYGTADATPLWLILLSEYWRFTGQDTFVLERWDKVVAALAWIDRYGDRDGDGYVEYQTRSREGLGNQCWKDSWDGVQFADGTIPHLPIATAEIQGYVYDAKLRVAELARRLRGDVSLAERLEREAGQLYDRFNSDFWSEDRGGYYVVGLDGDKRPIDSMTSNIGHLLWSGIVPRERAGLVAGQLMSDEMFSGWGVRTLSTDDRGYNPIGYHTGTIWPHDNAIVVLGLARGGFRDEANRIALAQLEAAAFTGYRLPEAFAGFERWVSRFPVPYPTACSPQAWATAAPFVFIQAMLGLEARDGEVRLDPRVPDEIGRICIRRLHAFGAEWEVEAVGTEGEVRRAEGEHA